MENIEKTYSNLIAQYDILFQDKDNSWLVCEEEVDIDYCRCLDLEELNIAMLWLGVNPKREIEIKLNNNDYYIVDVHDINLKFDDQSKYSDISWCKFCKSPPFFIKGLKDEKNVIKSRLFLHDYNFLFILLYIYRANISLRRSLVILFYFASSSNAFCEYIRKLEAAFNDGSIDEIKINEHVQLMKEVFHLYSDKQARSGFFKEDEDANDVLYGINCFGFCNEIVNTPIDKAILNKAIRRTCIDTFKVNNFALNATTIKRIYNIAKGIETKCGVEIFDKDFKNDFNDIYLSLKIIIEESNRGGEVAIERYMNNLMNLIQSR